MQQDLIKGYKNFLISSIKVYSTGCNIIQIEIDNYTNFLMKDGIAFFLCAFDKPDIEILKKWHFIDVISFREYVFFDDKKIILMPKGEALKLYLEQKLAAQACMLEFNGIKPEVLGKISTILKRFEKFWNITLTFAKKTKNAFI